MIGFDIDPQSLETATLNAEELEVGSVHSSLWFFLAILFAVMWLVSTGGD